MSLTVLMLNHSYFIDELRARGHTVILALPAARQRLTLRAGKTISNADLLFEDPISLPVLLNRITGDQTIDRIVVHDDSRELRVWDLQKATVPTLFYSIDCHIHPWHALAAALVDKAFVAQKDYLPAFQSWNVSTEWLPLWAQQLPPQSTESQRTIPACFRGSLDPEARPKRLQFFRELERLVPLDAGQGPWHEAYPYAQIVINDNSDRDLNFRVFEALSSGALLVTARIENGLSDLFQEGEHYVAYDEGNIAQAADTIRYYLEHPEERIRISRAGQALVSRLHTQTERSKRFIAALEECSATSRVRGPVASAYLRAFSAHIIHARSIKLAGEHLLSAVEEILSANYDSCPSEAYLTIASIICVLRKSGAEELAVSLARTLHARSHSNELLKWFLIDSLGRVGRKEEMAQVLGSPLEQARVVLGQGLSSVQKIMAQSVELPPLSAEAIERIRRLLS